MSEKPYYSTRQNINANKLKLDLPTVLQIFGELYVLLSKKGYFQQGLGFRCIDTAYDEYTYKAGTLGTETMVAAQIALKLNKDGLWPIEEAFEHYSEDDLFDVIEFLYDFVSKPLDWIYSHSDCLHYNKFDQSAGRRIFRSKINKFIKHYKDGYELSESGEILVLPEHGLEPLLKEESPTSELDEVQARIDSAINKFRKRNASLEDKRDAVRTLADVFEYLREDIKKVLTKKDEGDLFNIANNFAIRHHNDQQKTEYEKAIWYDWMFYFYLSTLQAMMKKMKRNDYS